MTKTRDILSFADRITEPDEVDLYYSALARGLNLILLSLTIGIVALVATLALVVVRLVA